MPIQVACPACNVPLQLPDDMPGRSFQCIRCGTGLATALGGRLIIQAKPAQAPNPFADAPTPGYYGPAGFSQVYYPPPIMSREMALAKVYGPAALLQSFGALCIVLGMALPGLLLLPDMLEDAVVFAVVLIVAPIALGVGVFTVFCGGRMKALRSYALVMSSVIVLLVAGLLVCPILALPGIWPLVVLLDGGVKANFDAQSPFRGS